MPPGLSGLPACPCLSNLCLQVRGKVSAAIDGLWWVFWLAAAAVATSILTDGFSINQTRASCAFCWISWCGCNGCYCIDACHLRAAAAGAAAPPAWRSTRLTAQCPKGCTCRLPPALRRALWTLSLIISMREAKG